MVTVAKLELKNTVPFALSFIKILGRVQITYYKNQLSILFLNFSQNLMKIK